METAAINKVLQLFNMLSRPEQLEIAGIIEMQTFEDRWKLADRSLPNVALSDDDIMNEVRAVRYAGK